MMRWSEWQACSGHMSLEYWIVSGKFLWIDVGSDASTNDVSNYNGS